MKKINFGIIGTSNISRWFLNGAKKVNEFNLSCVYSRSEEKAREFANEYGAKNIFTNIEEMAKSKELDAVYIASPNSLHKEQAVLFLKNGKHVLCEKAFASNLDEVNDMIQTARENNVILMEAMKTTLLPNFKEIINNIHKIGKVRRYFGSYCQYSSRYDKYKEGEILNAFKNEFSNGSLMDIGVYTIAPMVALFGKPKDIKASGYILNTKVDGEGGMIFKYDEMEALVMYSKISNSYLPSEIQGEEGSIIINKINNMEEVYIIYRDGRKEIISKEQEKDDMCYEIEEFINLINEDKKESKINSSNFSKILMEIMDEGRRQIGIKYPADKM